MFEWFKKIVREKVRTLLSPYLNQYTPLQLGEVAAVDKATQILLSLKYQDLLRTNIVLPFAEVGFRSYSQNDEDGILLYIFSLIGATNKRCVEICAGDGIENNTANLVVNHGWTGLMFDGNRANAERAQKFYAQCKDTWLFPPVFKHAWIDAENVNQLISSNGFAGEIDLLSLDVDGVDYWIWKAIECINPRVIVLEYQSIWGPHTETTVPYKKDFNRYDIHPQGYWGASLPAFIKLGREKGYRLVGCNRNCINAFFIRSGIAEDVFPEIAPDSCFGHPRVKHRIATVLPEVRNYEWVEV
jgi:hypothetical protein